MIRSKSEDFIARGQKYYAMGSGFGNETPNDRTGNASENSKTDGRGRDMPKTLDSGSGFWAPKEPSI
jgi:hypothetical protein